MKGPDPRSPWLWAPRREAIEHIARQRRKRRRGWTVQVYEDQLRFARGLRNAVALYAVVGLAAALAYHLLQGR